MYGRRSATVQRRQHSENLKVLLTIGQWPTNLPTNWLTRVGDKDAYASKKSIVIQPWLWEIFCDHKKAPFLRPAKRFDNVIVLLREDSSHFKIQIWENGRTFPLNMEMFSKLSDWNKSTPEDDWQLKHELNGILSQKISLLHILERKLGGACICGVYICQLGDDWVMHRGWGNRGDAIGVMQ